MTTVLSPRSVGQKLAVDHPTGSVAAAGAVLVWALGEAGLSLPYAVATALVAVAAVFASVLTPRVSRVGILKEYPAGIAAAVTLLLVWAAPAVGLDLDEGTASLIVGLAPVVSSVFLPRTPGKADTAGNVPSAGGTGPDEPGTADAPGFGEFR